MKTQKFLIITSSYLPVKGGLQNFLANLWDGLDSRGHRVSLFSGTEYMTPMQKLRVSQGEVEISARFYRTRSIKGFTFFTSIRFWCDLLRKCDNGTIINLNDVRLTPGIILLFGRLKRARISITSHGFVFHTQTNFFFKKVFMIWLGFLSNYLEKVICVSPQDLNTARRFRLKNAVLVPEGIDVDAFLASPRMPKNNRLLYFGRIAPNKNLESIFIVLDNDKQKYVLDIVGKGEVVYIQRLKQLADKLGISDRVHWWGPLPHADLLKRLHKCDAVTLPSSYEGFGLTFVEAIVAGSAVLANDIASYRWIAETIHAENCLVEFERTNAAHIDRLLKSFTGPGLYAIQARACEFFSKEAFIDRIEKELVGN